MNLNLRMAAGQTAVMAATGLASAALMQALMGAEGRDAARMFLVGGVTYPIYLIGQFYLLKWPWYRSGVVRHLRPAAEEPRLLSTRLLASVALVLVAAALVALGVFPQTIRILAVIAGVLATRDVADQMAHDAAEAQA
jgi:hypothetical protein